MTTIATLRKSEDNVDEPTPLVGRVAALAKSELTPILEEIDDGKIYPDEALRKFGGIGAWSAHVDPRDTIRDTISAISAIGEVCGATAFMAWCQDTLVWYILNSDNAALKAKYLADAASGKLLGGTGLSIR